MTLFVTEDIRLYFGESIALYFTFLGFYTTALLFPVFVGFLQLLISSETVPFFCIFNVVWVTVFLEVRNIDILDYAVIDNTMVLLKFLDFR